MGARIRTTMKIKGINHITIAVKNIEESFAFYTELLGLKKVMQSRTSAYLEAGDHWIALVRDDEMTQTKNYSHIAFSVAKDDYELLVQLLKNNSVLEWRENTTEGDSFYFLDPSGNKLELHVGDLKTRITDGKQNWRDNVEWYV